MKRTTLRRRIYLLVGQWFLLFLALSGLVTAYSLSRFKQGALDDRLLLARTLARSLDASLAALLHDLGRLPATLPALDAAAAAQLRSFRFQSSFHEAVHLLDGEGRTLAADPATAPPLPAAVLHGRDAVSGLYRRPGGRPALAVSLPFRRDGRAYRLVAEINPLGAAMSVFLQDLAAEPGEHLAVIDASGTVIAAPDQGQLFLRMPWAAIAGERIRARRAYVAEDATCSLCREATARAPALTVVVPLQNAPWGVVVEQHRTRALAALYASRQGFVLAGVTLALTGALLVRALSRSIVVPLRELARQAQGLRRGDLVTRLAVSGDQEVEELAATLDGARVRIADSLAQLAALNTGLEAEVASRLQQLRRQDEERQLLVRRLLTAGEEERRRIARELHDETSQLLTVIQLSLERVEGGGPEIARAQSLLARTQKEIHRIILDLRPSLLDDLGLAAAIAEHAQSHLAAGRNLTVEVPEDLVLAPETEIAVFRIYQELATNVLRHAQAENVSIDLALRAQRGAASGPEPAAGELVLVVEDDGVGFDPETKHDGAGLVGMRERAALVGGTIEFESEPGNGTTVRLRVPLAASPPAAAGAPAGSAGGVGARVPPAAAPPAGAPPGSAGGVGAGEEA